MPTIASTPATSPPSLTSITRLYYTPASTPATSPQSHTREVSSISRRQRLLALIPAPASTPTPTRRPRRLLHHSPPLRASTTRLPPLHACLHYTLASTIRLPPQPRHYLALTPATASPATTSPCSHPRNCLHYTPASTPATFSLSHGGDVSLLSLPRCLIHHLSHSRASTTRLPQRPQRHLALTAATSPRSHGCNVSSLSYPRLPQHLHLSNARDVFSISRRRRLPALMPATLHRSHAHTYLDARDGSSITHLNHVPLLHTCLYCSFHACCGYCVVPALAVLAALYVLAVLAAIGSASTAILVQ
ncbi:hypothetical protein CC86DRAFT_405847 [Ophiobolus disseminans]|uniref:Uncharacterized protein n=1 Tax=Ophiobolus disseminans TaxID=1469910 RepID=A0A6A7A0F9_9PLEO|nr:hypothetical protein CC86DRAFT_405847 [Ophiobolus disseminans]